MLPKTKKKKCICDTKNILKKITGTPAPLDKREINEIRLNLFTERNSDGTGSLVLRGNDIFQRYNRRITDFDIGAICRYIRELKLRVTKIDLCYNKITDVGFFKLLKKVLVKGRSSVLDLNIMNNELTDKSVLHLSKYAQFIKLKYLRLNGNDIGTKGGEYFADFLENNTSLERCDIGQSGQTLTSVAYIVTALRFDHGANRYLKVLDLSRVVPLFNRYQYETKWLAYHIEYLLERNDTIIELHLQNNEFIGHDIEYVLRGLRKNKTLLYLDLGYNKIRDYGIELIAEYFKEKPELVLLNVAGNNIGDAGARALSFGLPFSKIRALDISKNKLNAKGVLYLLNTIKKPVYLRFLNLFGNNFDQTTCDVISRMLLSGVLFQHTIDVRIYESGGRLHAAYYPNPADRNKHLYYCELDYGCYQPICKIVRKKIEEKKRVKVDCQQRHKLDKTNAFDF